MPRARLCSTAVSWYLLEGGVRQQSQVAIQAEESPLQQQSTTAANSINGDAVGTFKPGIPINTCKK
ncbi:hypothetical protein SD81_039665 [Tolypothrix campylonemoides VB511288]|nr:hypothetical protein SD81_039665 [Tolypothrix campylonemoides VB511288]